MAIKTKQLLDTLSRRGPHGVDTGDLGFTGIPGAVFVPRGGSSPAPLVAFAHDWGTAPRHYLDTAKHLASWGFVVVAPATDRSLRPHHQHFADHLSASIEDVLAATLGRGRVRADARRIGLTGHGLGGGVSALLTSQRTDIKAVAMLMPTDTVPSATARVVTCDASALILSAAGGEHAQDARDLHLAWHGPLVHRRLDKAIETGLIESGPLLRGLGLASPDRRTQRTVRTLLTGYLLATLMGDDDYAAFAEPEEKIKGTTSITDEVLQSEEDEALPSTPPLVKILRTVVGV